jgi:rhodanese-related sulfurtransferase
MKNLRSMALIGLLSLSVATALVAKDVPTPAKAPAGTKIATAEDIIDIKNNGGQIYDIRWHYSEYEFEGHVPGAISVPFTEWSALSTDYNIKEDVFDWSALPKDKNTPVAFYCMGVNCWKSYKVAEQAAKIGYKNVYWYKEGQPGWDKKQLPRNNFNPTYAPTNALFTGSNNPASWLMEPEVVKQMIEKGEKMKVIDFRFSAFFEEGRLKDAFQVPLDKLLSRDGIQLLPKPQTGTTILLVSENGQLAMAGAVALSNLGYKVKVLNGGMKAWYAKMGRTLVENGQLDNSWPGKSGWAGQNTKPIGEDLPIEK